MSEFDIKAAGWDDNPIHIERSKAVAAALKKMILINHEMDALEYGAGTGLLSFELKDQVNSITLMDNSEEMIKVLSSKIERSAVGNMKPLFFNLEKNEYNDKKFDLIYSAMVMHHVEDYRAILLKFQHILNNSGTLAIADLYTEDGSFHDSSFNGHKGFDTEELKIFLENNGFTSIQHQKCYTIRKTNEAGENREYPVFLMVAEKKM